MTFFKLILLAGISITLAAGLPSVRAETPPTLPKVAMPVIPKRAINLADFGAVGDGKTLNTAAFEKALDALAKKGGGELVVPPGIWLTGPIKLRSNLNFHLDRGALIKFSGDWRLYPLTVINKKGEREVDSASPISGDNLENVAITGEGIIDGGGDAWREVKKGKLSDDEWLPLVKSGGVLDAKGTTWYPNREVLNGDTLVEGLRKAGSLKPADYEPAHQYLRPRMVRIIGCKKLLLSGVTVQNPPNWTLNPVLCEDVTILNVTVHNAPSAQNSDALDLESCRRAIVRDSTFDAGDDGICLKCGKDAVGRRIGVPTEEVLIEGCTVYHAHGGFTIGSEMSGCVRNVIVNNCTFMGTHIGLRFKTRRGRGGVVEKIFISNIRMTDIGTEAIGFHMEYGEPSQGDEDAPGTASKDGVVNEGTPQFRDIYIQDVICRGASTAVFMRGLPEMPIRGIHLRNVSINSEVGALCESVQGITFDNVEIQNTRGPVVTLNGSQDVRMNGLTYATGAEALFKVRGKNNTGLAVSNTDLKAARQAYILTGGATAEALKAQP